MSTLHWMFLRDCSQLNGLGGGERRDRNKFGNERMEGERRGEKQVWGGRDRKEEGGFLINSCSDEM